jgi:hypothetical protein
MIVHHDTPASAETAFISRIIGDSAANSKLIKLVSLLVWPMCGAKDPGPFERKAARTKTANSSKKRNFHQKVTKARGSERRGETASNCFQMDEPNQKTTLAPLAGVFSK